MNDGTTPGIGQCIGDPLRKHCWHFTGSVRGRVFAGVEHAVACCYCARPGVALVTAADALALHAGLHGAAHPLAAGLDANAYEMVA